MMKNSGIYGKPWNRISEYPAHPYMAQMLEVNKPRRFEINKYLSAKYYELSSKSMQLCGK